MRKRFATKTRNLSWAARLITHLQSSKFNPILQFLFYFQETLSKWQHIGLQSKTILNFRMTQHVTCLKRCRGIPLTVVTKQQHTVNAVDLFSPTNSLFNKPSSISTCRYWNGPNFQESLAVLSKLRRILSWLNMFFYGQYTLFTWAESSSGLNYWSTATPVCNPVTVNSGPGQTSNQEQLSSLLKSVRKRGFPSVWKQPFGPDGWESGWA